VVPAGLFLAAVPAARVLEGAPAARVLEGAPAALSRAALPVALGHRDREGRDRALSADLDLYHPALPGGGRVRRALFLLAEEGHGEAPVQGHLWEAAHAPARDRELRAAALWRKKERKKDTQG
jgi:hypothetical protein